MGGRERAEIYTFTRTLRSSGPTCPTFLPDFTRSGKEVGQAASLDFTGFVYSLPNLPNLFPIKEGIKVGKGEAGVVHAIPI